MLSESADLVSGSQGSIDIPGGGFGNSYTTLRNNIMTAYSSSFLKLRAPTKEASANLGAFKCQNAFSVAFIPSCRGILKVYNTTMFGVAYPLQSIISLTFEFRLGSLHALSARLVGERGVSPIIS